MNKSIAIKLLHKTEDLTLELLALCETEEQKEKLVEVVESWDKIMREILL